MSKEEVFGWLHLLAIRSGKPLEWHFISGMTVDDIKVITFEENVNNWYQQGMPVWQDGDEWYPTGCWCGLTVNDINLPDLLKQLDSNWDLCVHFPDSEGNMQYINLRILNHHLYVIGHNGTFHDESGICAPLPLNPSK